MDMKWMAETAADISDNLDRLTFCRTYKRKLTAQDYQTFVMLLDRMIQEKKRPRPPLRFRGGRDMAP